MTMTPDVGQINAVKYVFSANTVLILIQYLLG